MVATFTQTAFAQLPPLPANFTGDPLQTTQALTGLGQNLASWTLRIANALNKLMPNGGAVPVSQGGTGLTTLTAHNVLLGEGTANVGFAAPGTAGIGLVSNGASADPSFTTLLVGGGGTGITSGTSGGIPYFSSTSTIASSAALSLNRVPVGGGAGASPADSSVDITNFIVNTGDGANTDPCGIELGNARSGNGNAYIDFHAVPATDFDFRIIRLSGTNGNVSIINTGTGSFGIINPAGVQISGTNTNDSASAGQIGEYASAIVLIASEVSISGGAANVVTLSLTAGDWNVSGEMWVDNVTGGATITNAPRCAITLSSAAIPTVPSDTTARSGVGGTWTFTASTTGIVIPVGPVRVSLSSTTNVFLVGTSTVSAGTLFAYGKLMARRVR